ncbi:AAA family ATPase, partial [Phascolarctobacterium succinatutens]|uniref:AAA family ATPase n=1 Tax=Phascolarctobacterium succinatutens TaxID=626940 RepID=UPI0026ECE1D2
GFYYVDKTALIEQLLSNKGMVNLFTRPRRFGKTLTMSMLRYFFEIGTDAKLFDGLYIAKNQKLCEAYLGKYPVISISIKDVDGFTFDKAMYSLVEVIANEAGRFLYLLDSDKLTAEDKDQYRAMISVRDGLYMMDEKILESSLKKLSELLYKHYEKKVIILIDEYDVPLSKAFNNGYYKEMVGLIRALFGKALKTNDALFMAVLTGCLRISKESIFTGLNNFKVLSILDNSFDEQFGFTEAEVKELLAAYKLEEKLPEIKEWYDGYRFGNADIYCPWDVINHVDRLRVNSASRAQSYWINTSSNELVKRFIDKADKTTRDEIEQLVAGEVIEKNLR